MKKLIIVLAVIVLGFTGVAYAKDSLTAFWSSDRVAVYKFSDSGYDTNCYVVVATGYSSVTSPAISCVK